jgi:3-polyprenyl-4-hydroxybenzoate decarboxylase
MKQRVSEAAADKAEKERCQEEAEKVDKKYKKLHDKHDAMVASTASGENASAGEWKMKAERDKLWVCPAYFCCLCRA